MKVIQYPAMFLMTDGGLTAEGLRENPEFDNQNGLDAPEFLARGSSVSQRCRAYDSFFAGQIGIPRPGFVYWQE